MKNDEEIIKQFFDQLKALSDSQFWEWVGVWKEREEIYAELEKSWTVEDMKEELAYLKRVQGWK